MVDISVGNISWGGRILQSFKGILVGLFFFFGSFVLLWMNEGRIDMSEVAKKESVPINSGSVDASAEGKFVSITGPIQSSEKLGDPDFLTEGPYIKLVREVEMYAWEEKSQTKNNKKTYEYEKEWTSNPESSANFNDPGGHENPSMPYSKAEFHVNNATVGAYPVDMSSIQLPNGAVLKISSDLMTSSAGKLEGDYLYIGQGSLSSPIVGDVRLRFFALRGSANVTAFGKVQQGSLTPYIHKKGNQLYRALEGTRDEAIQRMHFEYQAITWGLRIGGFLAMWIGLTLMFRPVTLFLDMIPVMGKVGGCAVQIFMFAVAFFLSLVTMLISMVVHNIIAVIVISLLLLIGIGVLLVLARQKAAVSAGG